MSPCKGARRENCRRSADIHRKPPPPPTSANLQIRHKTARQPTGGPDLQTCRTSRLLTLYTSHILHKIICACRQQTSNRIIKHPFHNPIQLLYSFPRSNLNSTGVAHFQRCSRDIKTIQLTKGCRLLPHKVQRSLKVLLCCCYDWLSALEPLTGLAGGRLVVRGLGEVGMGQRGVKGQKLDRAAVHFEYCSWDNAVCVLMGAAQKQDILVIHKRLKHMI